MDRILFGNIKEWEKLKKTHNLSGKQSILKANMYKPKIEKILKIWYLYYIVLKSFEKSGRGWGKNKYANILLT